MKKQYSLSDYKVEYKKMYQVDGSVTEYSLIWVPDSKRIENPPSISNEDITEIKSILHKYSVFEFKINRSL